MKQTRKMISLLMTAVMLLVLISSCAPANNTETSAPDITSGEIVTTAPVSTEPSGTGTDKVTTGAATTAATTAPAEPSDDCPFGKSFKSTDIFGESVDTSYFTGTKLTMINFWGTFCQPCLAEMFDLGMLYEEFMDSGFRIVGIAVDVKGTTNKSKAQSQVKGKLLAYANFASDAPGMSVLTAKYKQSNYIPETIFVDSDGKVLQRVVGSKNEAGWRSIIESLLEQVGK